MVGDGSGEQTSCGMQVSERFPRTRPRCSHGLPDIPAVRLAHPAPLVSERVTGNWIASTSCLMVAGSTFQIAPGPETRNTTNGAPTSPARCSPRQTTDPTDTAGDDEGIDRRMWALTLGRVAGTNMPFHVSISGHNVTSEAKVSGRAEGIWHG